MPLTGVDASQPLVGKVVLGVRGLMPWVLVAWKLVLIDLEPIARAAMGRFEASRRECAQLV